MPSIGRILVIAVAMGMVIGAALAIEGLGIGGFLQVVQPSTPLTAAVLGGLGFAIGFGGSVAVALADDLNATEQQDQVTQAQQFAALQKQMADVEALLKSTNKP